MEGKQDPTQLFGAGRLVMGRHFILREGGILEAFWRCKISLVKCPDCWVLEVRKAADVG